MTTQTDRKIEAYVLLLKYFKDRTNSPEDFKKFVGAVTMYQTFTGDKRHALSQRLHNDTYPVD